MNFSDGALRLKLLGYSWIKFHIGDIAEIHFIKPGVEESFYFKWPHNSTARRQVASYIYDVVAEKWTKERSPLEAMPLTETERILYGKIK